MMRNESYIRMVDSLRALHHTHAGCDVAKLLLTIAKNRSGIAGYDDDPLYARCLGDTYKLSNEQVDTLCYILNMSHRYARAVLNGYLTEHWQKGLGLIRKTDKGYYIYMDEDRRMLCAQCMMYAMDKYVGLRDISPDPKCQYCGGVDYAYG